MKEIYKNFLFSKQMLVQDTLKKEEETFSVLLALAKLFNVLIVSGKELAVVEHIRFVSEKLGENVPEPFYRGFPESVRALSFDELLLDQLLHYANTYGMGNFEQTGHSVLEKDFERTALNEAGTCKYFSILSQEEAQGRVKEAVESFLKSTRPLSTSAYQLVLAYIKDYSYEVKECLCKDTAMQLLIDTGNCHYADFITFSDIIKLADYINIVKYDNYNIKKLNWANKDRKLITAVINHKLENGECNIRECFEKQDIWCGLLHHIHYKPVNELAGRFVHAMRSEKNQSVYAFFEAAMARHNVKQALDCLREGKGTGAVLRNLNYLLSRCKNEEDIAYILENLHSRNPVLLIQLYVQYKNYNERGARTFQFTRHNKFMVHKENAKEYAKRKSFVSRQVRELVAPYILENLKELYHHQLGTVYIDEGMKKIALPLQETASMCGYGILPKGSRMPIEEGKFIRGFTYWEKVDDIDLSVMGITEDGRQVEFSWRTMIKMISPAIVYSGDETSGYKGGSEYYDIDLNKFKNEYPSVRYLVFCNNVYSRIPFLLCRCKAGYMIREEMNSGEVFEPKTVASSFAINCDSTFAYLFGIDLEEREVVWLNLARSGSIQVAGDTSFEFLLDYFKLTNIFNVYDLFVMLASELTDDASMADVVVTDKQVITREGAVVIRSCDYEKILAYMNGKG